MAYTSDAITAATIENPSVSLSSRTVLSTAHSRLARDSDPATGKPVGGSSTACVCVLNDSQLEVANLGDSAFQVWRRVVTGGSGDGGDVSALSIPTPPPIEDDEGSRGEEVPSPWRLVTASTEQTLGFNFPRQLGQQSSDSPKDADVYNVDVFPGDVVVLMTDGVTDNMWKSEIAMMLNSDKDLQDVVGALSAGRVSRHSGALTHTAVWQTAMTMASYATAVAHVQNKEFRPSPFEVSAKQHGKGFEGGKPDDVTVVLGLVQGAAEEEY